MPLNRNPRVTIEDWPDPEDDFAHSEHGSDSSEDNNEPTNGPDQDPEFIEQGNLPLGAHPEDKPLMNDNMLHAFLEMHLGDYTQDEWFNLCELSLPIKARHTN